TPEINRIDRVIGRLSADKTEADVRIIRSDLALDHVECPQRNLLGAFDARSRGSPKMQLQLAGIHDRKNLRAERAAGEENDCAADDEIGKHDDATSFHDRASEPI